MTFSPSSELAAVSSLGSNKLTHQYTCQHTYLSLVNLNFVGASQGGYIGRLLKVLVCSPVPSLGYCLILRSVVPKAVFNRCLTFCAKSLPRLSTTRDPASPFPRPYFHANSGCFSASAPDIKGHGRKPDNTSRRHRA